MPFCDTGYFKIAFTISIRLDGLGSISNSTQLDQNPRFIGPAPRCVRYLAFDISHNDWLFHLFYKTFGIGWCKIVYAAEGDRNCVMRTGW